MSNTKLKHKKCKYKVIHKSLKIFIFCNYLRCEFLKKNIMCVITRKTRKIQYLKKKKHTKRTFTLNVKNTKITMEEGKRNCYGPGIWLGTLQILFSN